MFQEALQFKDAIILCYIKENIVKIIMRVPLLRTLHISQIIMNFLSPIVSVCVLNQFSNNHWLLFDALQHAITMCLRCKEEFTNPHAQVNLIDDDYGIAFELYLFVTNIKKEVHGVLDSFLSF
jgi:hypothetical protein